MGSSQPGIVIVGSINMDLVVRAAHVPAPGETVLGRDFVTIPGGKGSNQAVGVARLEGRASMIGRVGDDAFGERLLAGLRDNGVDIAHVRRSPGVASGIAMIVVAEDGENAITVASGANFLVTPADIDASQDVLRAARVCLLQLELPVETVVHTLNLCRRFGVETILDPAPAPAGTIPAGLFGADILTPNESEAIQLSGLAKDADCESIAARLTSLGARGVVLKRGEQGAYYHTPESQGHVSPFRVRVVDTTAAGDAFTAALAVARAQGQPSADCVRFANAAGALACTQLGAQPSLPRLSQVRGLLG